MTSVRESTAHDVKTLYQEDLAFIQAAAFSKFSEMVSPAIVAKLRSLPRVRTVVDIGCGAGLTTRALSEAGFEVVAIEPSESLLDIARRNAPRARFVRGSVYESELPACDAVLAVGEPLTYHAPDVDAGAVLRRLFERVRAALSPGGMFAFDLIGTRGPDLDARGWKSEEQWAILYHTREDRAAARIEREIETFRNINGVYRRAKEIHHVRVFDEGEIARWLELAGFTVTIADGYGDVRLPARRFAVFATPC